MQIIPAFVTQNKCYQAGALLTPRGIMLHSVGTPQPSAAVFARSFNQYQPGGVSVCVHAFAQADGTVYQTLPWEMRGWHCGGSANSTHIGVEMTEPSAGMTYAEAAEQIAGTYHTAVELFAALCKQYELDPAQDGVIIGHAEGHRRGVASNHADPELLWRTYDMGYTMDGFRRDVAEAMAKEDREEVPDMPRYDSVAEMPQWARADAQRLIDRGVLSGVGNGKLDLSLDMIRTMIVCQRMLDEDKETEMDRLTTIKAAVSAAAAALTAFWGWTGWLAAAWFLAMLLDYATGSAAALRAGTWSSRCAREGLWHKAGSVAGVLVAALLDFALRALLGSVPGLGAHYDVLLCPLVTAWYLLTELGSVVENAGALGAPLPQFLVRAIAVLRADISQHGGGDDDA